MKIPLKTTQAAAPRRQRGKNQPRQRGHADSGQAAPAHDKAGAYKRVEIYLGVEAAIALRQLMRDGRSARDVVEALLLAEKQRRKAPVAPDAG